MHLVCTTLHSPRINRINATVATCLRDAQAPDSTLTIKLWAPERYIYKVTVTTFPLSRPRTYLQYVTAARATTSIRAHG